ncbi:hypothetical protein JTE90_001345 [Oedothorax gibbosus]|uniref:Uncharacterized protein n=1 Tax=Oedothorax gibbosus TaxID=931172 RepID=A0AAV6V2I5_9ARAC|nr:hypothetical protein JTE90_001345 [Oedothorax gibbosus]
MESPETLRSASNQECILVFLATGDKTRIGTDLQGAFASWQNLSENEKISIGRHIQESSDSNYKILYDTLVGSFNVWEQFQDTVGAPGWLIKDTSVAEIVRYIGSDLLKLLNSMEEAWQKILKESEDCNSVVKKVGSRMELPEPTSVEKNIAESSQETPKAALVRSKSKRQVETDWTSDRKDRISPDDCKKIRAIMYKALYKDNVNENNKNSVPVTHLEPPSGAMSHPNSISPSLEEVDRFRDLLIDDRLDDSDFEKQISPMSVDEQD